MGDLPRLRHEDPCDSFEPILRRPPGIQVHRARRLDAADVTGEGRILVTTGARTWPEEGVAVELDGRAAHPRAAAFEEDRARDAALTAIGLRPLRLTWHRVTREGADVSAELVAALAHANGGLRAA